MKSFNSDICIKACRVCLEQNDTLLSLFEKKKNISHCDNLIRCTKFVISQNDGGPAFICKPCLHDLNNTIYFIEKCAISNTKIKCFLEKGHIKNEARLDCVHIVSKNEVKEEDSDDDNMPEYYGTMNQFEEKDEQMNDVKIESIFEGDDDLIAKSEYDANTFVATSKRHKVKLKLEPNKRIRKQKLDISPKEEKIPKRRGRKPKTFTILNEVDLQYQCAECTKRFDNKRTLRNHIRVHSKGREHTCEQCGKQFKYKDNLKVHMLTHSGLRPHACDMCDKTFPKKDNLVVHRKRHLQERDYRCEECGAAYYTSYELKAHRRAHSGEKPHACTLCGKRFTAKNNLYIHQRSHTGEKPHVCPVCGKKFISSNILVIHKRIHTGEKPYVCSVCGKRFAANKLAVHMRTHTGEKPHTCTLCGSQFASSNVLSIHMRRHTGEKPYSCSVCGQRYAHTQSLNKHVRRQHNQVKALETNKHQVKNVGANDSSVKAELDEKHNVQYISVNTISAHKLGDPAEISLIAVKNDGGDNASPTAMLVPSSQIVNVTLKIGSDMKMITHCSYDTNSTAAFEPTTLYGDGFDGV